MWYYYFMDKRSKILVVVFVLFLVASVSYTAYQTFVNKDMNIEDVGSYEEEE